MADTGAPASRGFINRALAGIEYAGNKLPDPAALFLILLVATWIVSYFLAPVEFSELNPRTGEAIRVANQLTGPALAQEPPCACRGDMNGDAVVDSLDIQGFADALVSGEGGGDLAYLCADFDCSGTVDLDDVLFDLDDLAQRQCNQVGPSR